MDYKIDPEILKPKALKKWRGLLPGDVKTSLGKEKLEEIQHLDDFCEMLSELPENDLPSFLEENVDILLKLGRTGRVRLLAWLTHCYYMEFPEIVRQILIDEDEDGESRQSGGLFGEDIERLNEEVFAQRLQQELRNKNSIDSIRYSALTLETTIPKSPGGGPPS